MDDTIRDARNSSTDPSTTGGGKPSGEGEVIVEAEVGHGSCGSRGEDQRIRTMESHTVRFGLNMPRVHVEIQFLLGRALVIDIPKEGTTG